LFAGYSFSFPGPIGGWYEFGVIFAHSDEDSFFNAIRYIGDIGLVPVLVMEDEGGATLD